MVFHKNNALTVCIRSELYPGAEEALPHTMSLVQEGMELSPHDLWMLTTLAAAMKQRDGANEFVFEIITPTHWLILKMPTKYSGDVDV
jgi:hypothetical protein